ncbi:MAG: PAS domain S-box protein [Bacteroidetes bacterium]|nr:PAS domain S-box protein [Bacteroidota bacterium]
MDAINDSKLLEQKREEMNLIFENSDVILILMNKDVQVVQINKAGIKLAGKSRSEILGLLGGEVLNCINAWDENNLVCGRGKKCEYCVVRNNVNSTYKNRSNIYKAEGPFEILSDGKKIKLYLSVSTSLLEFNNEEFVLLTIDDITSLKEVENEVIEQRNLSQKYLQTSGVMMCALNIEGEITLINNKGLDILEYEEEKELLGKNWFELSLPKNIVPDVKGVFNQLMSGDIEPVEYYENSVLTKNGKERIIAFHNTILQDKENKISGVLFSGEDITKRKQNEYIIKQQNKELRELNLSKDRFISILAHDLRSPFHSILGFLDILSENAREFEIDEIEMQLNFINDSSKRVFNLLEDILMWANAQSGNIPFEPQKFSFTKTCEKILKILKPNSITKNININLTSDSEMYVYADKNMLKTILRNIISNAIKFTNNNGQIEILTKQNLDITTVSISDNGTGIKPEILNKLFDISQVYSTEGTAQEKGTGIGLLLCKEFVEKHNGKIWVESEKGKGSTFYFTIPNLNKF